jgi:hypothetical protein
VIAGQVRGGTHADHARNDSKKGQKRSHCHLALTNVNLIAPWLALGLLSPTSDAF